MPKKRAGDVPIVSGFVRFLGMLPREGMTSDYLGDAGMLIPVGALTSKTGCFDKNVSVFISYCPRTSTTVIVDPVPQVDSILQPAFSHSARLVSCPSLKC